MGERACPCCGYRTLTGSDPGSYEFCPVCDWEDDLVQFRDPDYWGGANGISLRDAQRNFEEFGASDRDSLKYVTRKKQDDGLRSEYRFDYRAAKPNRFAGRIKKGCTMVVLDPDVAQVFTSGKKVNAALRAVIAAMS